MNDSKNPASGAAPEASDASAKASAVFQEHLDVELASFNQVLLQSVTLLHTKVDHLQQIVEGFLLSKVNQTAKEEAKILSSDHCAFVNALVSSLDKDWTEEDLITTNAVIKMIAENIQLKPANAHLGPSDAHLSSTDAHLSSTDALLTSSDALLNASNPLLSSSDALLSSSNAHLSPSNAHLRSSNALLPSSEADQQAASAPPLPEVRLPWNTQKHPTYRKGQNKKYRKQWPGFLPRQLVTEVHSKKDELGTDKNGSLGVYAGILMVLYKTNQCQLQELSRRLSFHVDYVRLRLTKLRKLGYIHSFKISRKNYLRLSEKGKEMMDKLDLG